MIRIAIVALIAASIPTPPVRSDPGVIIARLCDGGTVSISLGDGEPPAPAEPCHLKACHAGACRMKPRKAA